MASPSKSAAKSQEEESSEECFSGGSSSVSDGFLALKKSLPTSLVSEEFRNASIKEHGK